jgi:hypothetical protein
MSSGGVDLRCVQRAGPFREVLLQWLPLHISDCRVDKIALVGAMLDG